MNVMKFCRKNGAKLAVVAAAPLALAGQAWAEVPESVKTDLATAKTDALSVAAIVLGIIASIFAITLIRRVLR
nr:MAG TPA: coat protein [Inoviridae sp.]